jgi:enamine deaminase RidA (YjgF/YER057c/UK114 family)
MIYERYSSGTEWEDRVGYSRGVRVGNLIEIAGTTAVDAHGEVVGKDDPARQTTFIIEKAVDAIGKLGGTIHDVVRTRIYVTDISAWEAIGKAHGEFFSKVKPAVTMVEVSRLIQPELLVEIEFTAFIRD